MNVRAVAVLCVVFIMVFSSISFVAISDKNVSADASPSDPVPATAEPAADIDPIGLFDVLDLNALSSDSGRLLTETAAFTSALPLLGSVMVLGNSKGVEAGQTIVIDKSVTVKEGDPTYTLGDGNTYRFENQSWLTFDKGAKFAIDGAFTIEGNEASIMVEEGSILVFYGHEYVVPKRLVFSIAGELKWDLDVNIQGNTSLSATLSVTLDGSMDINHEVTMDDNGSTVLSANITAETTKSIYEGVELSDIKTATLDLRLRLNSIVFLNDKVNLSLSSLSIDYVATLDVAAQDYLSSKGNFSALVKLTNPNDMEEFKTEKKVDAKLTLTMPKMPTSADFEDMLPLFDLYMLIDISDPSFSSDTKEISLDIHASTSGDGDQRLLSVSVKGDSSVLTLPYQDEFTKGSLRMEGLDIDISMSVGAKFAVTNISDPIAVLDASTLNGHIKFKKVILTAKETQHDLTPVYDLEVTAYGLSVSANGEGGSENLELKVDTTLMTIEINYYTTEKQHLFFRLINFSGTLTMTDNVLALDAEVDYMKYSMEYVLTDTMFIEMSKSTFRYEMVDGTDKTNLYVKKGRVTFGQIVNFDNIDIANGVDAKFNDLDFTGTSITIHDGAKVSGSIIMPMVPGRTLTVADRISVAFKEDKPADLKVPLDGSPLLIYPFSGFVVDECPSDADYVKYTIDDSGRGVTESSKGVFSAQLSHLKSAVTIKGVTNYYDAFSVIDLPVMASNASQVFMGWYDGAYLYTTQYTVPARDVVFKEIWATSILKSDIYVDDENKTVAISVETDGVTISENLMDFIRYKLGSMDNGRLIVNLPLATIQMDVISLRALYGSASLWVGAANSTTMPYYSKSIADGVVYRIHLMDTQGEKHNISGKGTIIVPYYVKNIDYTVHAYYMDEIGRLTDCLGVYSLVTKTVEIPVSHFSDFVIKETKDYQDKNSETDFILFSAIVIIIATTVALYFVRR